MKIADYLNRYTSLPYLLDALRNKRLVLRSPEQWEDKNDAFYLRRYQEEMEFETLLALCFNVTREQFHHWKCFADGPSGVCIEFRRRKLLAEIKADPNFRCGSVDYRKIEEVEKVTPPEDEWPFLKRITYRDEKEYRVIFQSHQAGETAEIPFTIATIRRITLSPWLPRAVADNVTEIIRSLPECAELKIARSSLLENARWRQAIA